MATFDSDSFPAGPLITAYRRADVELHGVDQAVPSYEGRMFLNRPDADRTTPLSEDEGYIGSFFVFGKVECWGDDEEHCAPATGRKFDARRPPPRYAKVRVRTPEGVVRRLAERAAGDLSLHIVAVAPEAEERPDMLRFDRLSIVTYV
jgi:hypothetical protein